MEPAIVKAKLLPPNDKIRNHLVANPMFLPEPVEMTGVIVMTIVK